MLLGSRIREAATIEEKRRFRDLCKRLPLVTQSELDEMQHIEHGLTREEYDVLKFGE